jgi:hypothetical protein
MSHSRSLKKALQSLFDRWWAGEALKHLLWLIALWALSCGLAAGVSHAGTPRAGWVILTLVSVGTVGCSAWWFFILTRRRRYNSASHARLAQKLFPELDMSPESSFDLARAMETEEVHFSRALAEAYCVKTLSTLAALPVPERLRQTQGRPLKRAGAGALAALCLCSFSFSFFSLGWERLARALSSDQGAIVSKVPVAGDIRLTYFYPAYTLLKSKVVEGGNGSIRAIRGSSVRLEAMTDMDLEEATLVVQDLSGSTPRRIPMEVNGRAVHSNLSLMHRGSYRFELQTEQGDRIIEQESHPIEVLEDTYPVIRLDAPKEDIELKDNQELSVLWHASDDFGLGDINLVINTGREDDSVKVSLERSADKGKRLEGSYRWHLSSLKLRPGDDVEYFLEAYDGDTLDGPKRSVSVTRRIKLFSAQEHHQKLLQEQEEVLYALVDWLARELEAATLSSSRTMRKSDQDVEKATLEALTRLSEMLQALIGHLDEDVLTAPEVVQAFANIGERVGKVQRQRSLFVSALGGRRLNKQLIMDFNRNRKEVISALEKDIIYLDDLLALQRIDVLKATASDLLAAQRDLQSMLEQYKTSKDPQLKARLSEEIQQLRQRMMELLAKMASVKKNLPGEYRNMESASMMELGDQLKRLEEHLDADNLEAAAAELEQLANMIENMVDRIDQAEQDYGGERYDAMRQELADFAESFNQIEDQQKALAERTKTMLDTLRKQSMKKLAGNTDDFVKKVRHLVGEAMQAQDAVAELPYFFSGQKSFVQARQALLDSDALLEHKDFSEARDLLRHSIVKQAQVGSLLGNRQLRFKNPAPQWEAAIDGSRVASNKIQEAVELLNELFPESRAALSDKELAQLNSMEKKQSALEEEASELVQKMQKMAAEMPLFGDETQAMLERARQEMGQSQGQMQEGRLGKASGHEERALSELGKMRESLEQASQKGKKGGLPLPLGGRSSQRGRSQGRQGESEDVDIPMGGEHDSGQRLRDMLRKASKQEGPEKYRDAVRRYYKELMR